MSMYYINYHEIWLRMKFFKDLFLDKEDRAQTEAIIDAGWSEVGEWILLSTREKNGFQQFYLFNCIKIWESKLKRLEV